MKNIYLAFLLTLCLWSSLHAAEIIRFTEYASVEFNPTQGQTFRIPFHLATQTHVTISLYTSDGDLIRELMAADSLPPGDHFLEWDGKDSSGTTVPDEAYLPVLTAYTGDNETVTIDHRDLGGGEEIEELHVAITPDQHIEYSLPVSARVLIRAGIKNGPMLRSLANWVPKAPGKNIQRWDGYDQDYLLDLREEKRLSVLVTAFKLPPYAIITFGNQALTYRQYHKNQGWQDKQIAPSEMILVKDGQRISRHYYYPRTRDIDPDIILQLPDHLPLSENELPLVRDRVKIKVDIPEADRWTIQESLYEIAFYVDHEFISEEEQGYVPLTWIWKPVGLEPGKHILTVNVSGFRGQVGVKSILFVMEE